MTEPANYLPALHVPFQSSMKTLPVCPTSHSVRFQKEWIEGSVPDCFKHRASLHADRVAVSTAEKFLTYRELDVISNGVARAILSLRGPVAEPIAFLLEHDAAVPATVLGILKAGKFYVPLDPSNPFERNRWILEDSQSELIITNSKNRPLAGLLSGNRRQILNVDEIDSCHDHDCPEVPTSGDDLAFVLYTSGSTGKPKGVMHTHRSLLHKVMRHTNGRQICAGDRIALLFSYSVGASATNLFSALLNGATLFPFDLKELGVARLAQWLMDQEITMFHTVPTVFRHFVDTLNREQTFPKLRLIRLGGETMVQKDLERFKRYFHDNCVLHVGMGSGETGVVLECFFHKKTEWVTDLLPAGYAAEDTEVLLVDENRQSVGFERIGEIAVKGQFLSPGYWRHPELTRASFLPDPKGGDERIYLTGDLGYMLPDGCVFHLGRKDTQVKIRGYRVETGEIEAALLNITGVQEAVVIVQEDLHGDKRLLAYVVLNGEPSPGIPALRRSLREKLPGYMVPSAFVVLDSFPLLPSGKVDHQALSQFVQTARASDNPGTAPLTLLETQLCAIWEELLGLPAVGIHDDFFDLGGDSLLAVKMGSQIEEVCGKKLSLSGFNEITIERLSRALMGEERENFKTPLTAIYADGSKRPLFFLHGDFETGGFYCRNLARHLGPDQPFYALPPHGLDGCPVPESIEAMAADRVQTLLAAQPSGPYLLGGFCNGGIVAFEMARQLQQRGEKVEVLLLIDVRERNAPFSLAAKVAGFLALVLRLKTDRRRKCFQRLRWFSTGLQEAWQRGAFGLIGFLLKKSENLTIEFCQVLARPAQLLLSRHLNRTGSDFQTTPSAPMDNLTALRLALHDALEDYVPGKYSGPIVLFRSSSHLTRFPGDPSAGWRCVAPQVEVHSLPGDHRACVTRNVAYLAEKIQPYLARTFKSESAIQVAGPDSGHESVRGWGSRTLHGPKL